MRLTLTPDPISVAEMNAMFDKIIAIPGKMAEHAFERAFEGYSQAVLAVFDAEGPGWSPLAYRTREQRSELGYGAAHPILVREGYLRDSLTKLQPEHTIYEREVVSIGGDEELVPQTTGNVVEESALGADDDYVWWFGTVDDRFQELNAKRPMLPSDTVVGPLVEAKLLALLKEVEA